MTHDDRFERDLAAVVREGAPELAPPALRRRVAASISVAAAGRATRRAPLFIAAAGAIALLVVSIGAAWFGRPAPTVLQTGAARPTEGAVRSPLEPTPAATLPLLREPITDPGEVQVGDLLTATDGWVYNTDGHLFLTHSGGAAWREVTPPGLDPSREYLPSFVDPRHGWVAQLDRDGGQDLRVWRTTDAGQTWLESRVAGAELVIGGLAFLDPSNGYLTTDPGGQHPKPELRWTHDGGATWSDPIDLATATGIPTLQVVDFLDQQAGIMTGDNTLLRTNDGGRTWARPDSLDPDAFGAGTPRYGAVDVVDATAGFIIVKWLGQDGKEMGRTIIESRDAGASWKTAFTDRLHRYWAFVDALDWIGTDGRQVWSTTDGGLTFESPPSTGLPVVLDFAAMDFVDPQHGWAQATGGPLCKGFGCLRLFELLKTDDGGRSWSLVGSCEPGDTLSFVCPSPRPS
jgi:photosystem II stability/assembly factor-like uncharacterized protein